MKTVEAKWSCNKWSMLPRISGNFLSPEQPEKLRISSAFMSMMLGKLLSFLQFFKFNKISLLSFPIDGWSISKLEQPSRISFSRLGAWIEMSRISMRCWEQLSLIVFNFSRSCNRKIIIIITITSMYKLSWTLEIN